MIRKIVVDKKNTAFSSGFRKLDITKGYKSFIHKMLDNDPDMFPEGEEGQRDRYVETYNKYKVRKLREIATVNDMKTLGIVYSSKPSILASNQDRLISRMKRL